MNATASVPICGILPCLAVAQPTYWLLWGGSLALSVTLVVLLWTRWGQSRPLHKCAALSLIVHLILVFLTMTVGIFAGDEGGGGGGPPIRVRIVDDVRASPEAAVASNSKALLTPIPEATTTVAPPLFEPPKVEPPTPPVEVEKPDAKTESTPVVADATPNDSAPTPTATDIAPTTSPPAEAVAETSRQPDEPTTAPAATTESVVSASEPSIVTADPVSKSKESPTINHRDAEAAPVAGNAYSLRNAPNRLSLVAGQGGSAETEAAVAAALQWLADAQSSDGRWDAMRYGGGREELTLGQNRGGAGRGADTGVSALAILAFLGAGHSHTEGAYRDNVRRGLDFLLRSQATDGSLFGDATLYAQMYCHSMATFALAEALAVTGDRRLSAATTKAVNYSLAAQNASTGGWRYRPGDTGDTSQLGWQIMALASAERAGIKVPDRAWAGVGRFLRTVQRGAHGGLASYRPDSPASTSMTAEALYCRVVLEDINGTRLGESAAAEATAQLLAARPNQEQINLYYWYYATLALHHRQRANESARAAWRSWNDAMTTALTRSQLTTGENAGSWESNTMWGGYGGRIYTTAMATMCLEVYYRYAPSEPHDDVWSAERPGRLSTPR